MFLTFIGAMTRWPEIQNEPYTSHSNSKSSHDDIDSPNPPDCKVSLHVIHYYDFDERDFLLYIDIDLPDF
jgi:hypothetical protein